MSISQTNTKINDFTDNEPETINTPVKQDKPFVKHVIFNPVVDIVYIENFKLLYNQLENQCERVAMNKRDKCVSCGCFIS